MNLEWIKTLDFEKYLSEDEKDMVRILGVNKYLELLDRFKKTTVYFTDRSILAAKKDFIVLNRKTPAKQLARDLELSEMTIYNVLREYSNSRNDDNLNLFDNQENR